MKRFIWAAYACIVAALFAVETAVFADDLSPWRRCAGLFWLACAALVILTALGAALAPFFKREFWSQPHRAWYVAAFILPPVLVLFNCGGTRFTPVDGEGLAQLAGGMALIRDDTGLGIFKLSYYSYTARQYVLNCLPTCLFGPSLWAARLGNAMLYLVSYGLFLSGLAAYLKSRKAADPLLFSAYCGALIALGQYALLSARKFEQTATPIAVTLLFLGALMHVLVEPAPLRLLWLAWAFGFFPECYTPALGAWVLGLAILIYQIARERRRILIPAALYGAACLYAAYRVVEMGDAGTLSYKFRLGIGHGTPTDWTLRYLHSMRAMVGSDYSLIPGPLALLLLGAAWIAWSCREYRFGAVCAWALAIAAISVTTLGSNLNLPYYDIHRALIVLPPLALGAVLLLVRFLAGTPSAVEAIKAVMKLSMVYMMFTGTCTALLVRSFFGSTVMSDYDEVFSHVDALARSSPPSQLKRLYLVPPLDVILEPGLACFAPEAEVVRSRPPAGERIPGTYVLSYISDNPDDRVVDQRMPNLHERPFVRMAAEQP